MKRNKQAIKSLGDEETDDSDVGNEYSGTFWHCLLPEDDWKQNLQIKLTRQEAEFLKQRILLSSNTENSLFAGSFYYRAHTDLHGTVHHKHL
ncbi:hypothetical protein WQ54_12515 [Bacillus sp. SA1-12]|uniref:hypothetical protein n=1 Tax=Bacillus sp. SA1-12 TaxID=1455638 RepID=UPI000625D6F0|nr:hypothetical protein [Bacillus sp. SA1-12]KKI91798.1 hypothetical protein WQ54_12515 [Bacillus sp. SA1-12]